MKLPRGVSADRLIRALDRLGYRVARQKGSHVRLRHDGPPAHSITVPMHDSLKTGTLHAILTEVSQIEINRCRNDRCSSLNGSRTRICAHIQETQ